MRIRKYTCLFLTLFSPCVWSLPILPLPCWVLEISLAICWGKVGRGGANFSFVGLIYHYRVLAGCYLTFNCSLPERSLKNLFAKKNTIFFLVISSSVSWRDDPVYSREACWWLAGSSPQLQEEDRLVPALRSEDAGLERSHLAERSQWGSKHHQSDLVFWPTHHWTRPGKSLPFQRFHKCSIYLLFFLFSLWSSFFPTTKIPWCFHMAANYSAIQRDEILIHVTTWADLKGITLSAKSHSEKVIHCIRPFYDILGVTKW